VELNFLISENNLYLQDYGPVRCDDVQLDPESPTPRFLYSDYRLVAGLLTLLYDLKKETIRSSEMSVNFNSD
jgi:hypothetical protein